MSPVGGCDISSWPHDLGVDERCGSRQADRGPAHPLSLHKSRMSVFSGCCTLVFLQAVWGKSPF